MNIDKAALDHFTALARRGNYGAASGEETSKARHTADDGRRFAWLPTFGGWVRIKIVG